MILADAPPGSDLWQQYLAIQFDLAHLFSELAFTLVEQVFEFIAIYLIWKRVLVPAFHKEIDEEHGVTHVESYRENTDHYRRDTKGLEVKSGSSSRSIAFKPKSRVGSFRR